MGVVAAPGERGGGEGRESNNNQVPFIAAQHSASPPSIAAAADKAT